MIRALAAGRSPGRAFCQVRGSGKPGLARVWARSGVRGKPGLGPKKPGLGQVWLQKSRGWARSDQGQCSGFEAARGGTRRGGRPSSHHVSGRVARAGPRKWVTQDKSRIRLIRFYLSCDDGADVCLVDQICRGFGGGRAHLSDGLRGGMSDLDREDPQERDGDHAAAFFWELRGVQFRGERRDLHRRPGRRGSRSLSGWLCARPAAPRPKTRAVNPDPVDAYRSDPHRCPMSSSTLAPPRASVAIRQRWFIASGALAPPRTSPTCRSVREGATRRLVALSSARRRLMAARGARWRQRRLAAPRGRCSCMMPQGSLRGT